MNIIMGVSHPKHVYIFKNLYYKLVANKHNVLVLASDKEITIDLLDKFKIPYTLLGKNQKRYYLKILQVIKFFFITLYYSFKFKPDVFLGFGYFHFAFASFLIRKPFIFPEDTEVAKNVHKLILPFTSSFLTTKGFKNKLSHKQIWFNGNLELAYLHPNYFKINQDTKDKYVLLRFVSWDAFHDKGHYGLSLEFKKELVRFLSKTHKVYIASESKLPEYFEKFRINISIEKIHEFEYGADLVIGESPTMTTESAVLGTPAICISSWACNALGNFTELYKEEMAFCYHPDEESKALEKAKELLHKENLSEEWHKKAHNFMKSRIDVTAFFLWFIEDYPQSHKIMKANPDYQNRFK